MKLRIVILFIGFQIFAFNKSIGQYFIGHYKSESEETFSTMHLDIRSNGTYKFELKGEGESVSEGKWKQKNDILYLSDEISKGFDIKVSEDYDSTKTDIHFHDVVNSDSAFEYDARLVPNETDSLSCKITYGACIFKAGTIHNFRLTVGEDFRSESYTVQSKKSNVFDIVIERHYLIGKYRVIQFNAHLKDKNTVILYANSAKLHYPKNGIVLHRFKMKS